nr:putative reverse transcriptase domain-containing protein [Tanacetum cinerariifolium]
MPPMRSEGEELKYPFFEGDGSSFDEWREYRVTGDDYEGPLIFDDDQFEDELEMGDDIFVLIGKEVAEDSEIPEGMIPLLEEFIDVFPDEMSPREHEELRRQVEELISKGHVRESMSPCVVPALLTPKMDGTWRMRVDSRAINKITVRYMFPIPRLDDLLDQISGATIFTKLDLKSGYYQIRLRPGDELKTDFKTREGLYEWPFIGKFVVVYFDDILIYSASFNEHVTHVRQVLTLLRKDSFYAATKKCVFMTPKVLFLGYVVYGDGILVDESKVAVVQEWPAPTTITEVRSFHGLASFYRRFIPNFSVIMAHLTDCMKGKPFVWTEEAELAFQVVKEKLTTTPILVLHDFSKVFELHTDASKVAIGGVLSQGGRPLAYFSEKLIEPKSWHTTYDLEFYAVVRAVSHKHGRWLAFLEKFTFVVKHKTGVSNRAADALSMRNSLLMIMQVDVPGLDVIHDMVTVDPYFLELHGEGHVDFEVGDFVWAVLTKDRFLVGEYNKLSAKKIGLLKIVEKMNSNAYRLKLLSHIRCSDVFNVKHLLLYHGNYSDEDSVGNSRTNFVYPEGNDVNPSIEERADLFLEAQDRVDRMKRFRRLCVAPSFLEQEQGDETDEIDMTLSFDFLTVSLDSALVIR